jgi:hypothetical protein
MRVKERLSEEAIDKAAAIAADLFECELGKVTDKQLNFVLSLLMGVEI